MWFWVLCKVGKTTCVWVISNARVRLLMWDQILWWRVGWTTNPAADTFLEGIGTVFSLLTHMLPVTNPVLGNSIPVAERSGLWGDDFLFVCLFATATLQKQEASCKVWDLFCYPLPKIPYLCFPQPPGYDLTHVLMQTHKPCTHHCKLSVTCGGP